MRKGKAVVVPFVKVLVEVVVSCLVPVPDPDDIVLVYVSYLVLLILCVE